MSRIASSVILGFTICQSLHPFSVGGEPALGQASGFVEEFDGDWGARWDEERLAAASTSYRVVNDQGDSVLLAQSQGGASALVRRVEIPAAARGRIAWRWRIGRAIVSSRDENQKSGDDYSGRLFVMFDGDFGDDDARALCYVWAEHLSMGSIFPSPYSDSVAMVVVAGAPDRREGWISVERDYVQDYEAYFGELPKLVTGVAILVDTDNTGSEAIMFFDRVELE